MQVIDDILQSSADDERDRLYFEQVFRREEGNRSRYESQARELIANKVLITNINGALLRYKLKSRGCGCEISRDQGKSFQHASWMRVGWRKSSKLESLPLLFASTETDLILKD